MTLKNIILSFSIETRYKKKYMILQNEKNSRLNDTAKSVETKFLLYHKTSYKSYMSSNLFTGINQITGFQLHKQFLDCYQSSIDVVGILCRSILNFTIIWLIYITMKKLSVCLGDCNSFAYTRKKTNFLNDFFFFYTHIMILVLQLIGWNLIIWLVYNINLFCFACWLTFEKWCVRLDFWECVRVFIHVWAVI